MKRIIKDHYNGFAADEKNVPKELERLIVEELSTFMSALSVAISQQEELQRRS